MKVYIVTIIVIALSCNTRPAVPGKSGSSDQVAGSEAPTTYKLRLTPAGGSKYYYDVANESETELEVEGKKMAIVNKTNVGIIYTITKDSSDNFLLNLKYDKIQIYSKSGETEKVMDVANAALSMDPVEKMLGILKSANITATINSKGEVISMTGYKELGDKVLAGFNAADVYSRETAHRQWQQLIEEGVIKKNMDQLFKIFPDSLVQVGETWSMDQKQKGEIELKIKTTYTLESIDKDLTHITSTGEIGSDSATSLVMGQNIHVNIKGKQKGEYEVESATGMMISNKIVVDVDGLLEMMGRTIPVEIKNTIKTKGRKL